MILYTVCVAISSLSFLMYGISYFIGTHMKSEFIRFGLQKYAVLTIVLEIIGALGLIAGYFFSVPLLLVSASGLSLLMFMGVIVRLRLKDSLLITLPALFFMALNFYISYYAITQI